ncbi:MAG: LysR family transcriptional regulator [Peptoniphilus sp.]|nr:LysR family transcriptional regulator [Peptoniphilus sp.]MDD7363476.1 LysR family transcriptional regulator [Bacillota bacterium]MDY6044820.1 LysR family transcriptional regulator [Peptoniphilus sp.]
MIDLQKLSYFIAVVENQFNITKAAQELYISQPALSNAIRSIEREEEISLFIRNKGRYTDLTPSGRYLYDEGKVFLRRYNKMIDQVHHIGNHYIRTVNIAAPPFLLRSYLSSILFPLNERFPKVEFIFHECDQNSLKEGLLNQTYDIGFMTEPNDYNNFGISKTPIDHSKFAAILSKKHPLANKDFLDWEDIVDYPLSVPASKFATYHLIQYAIHSRGLEAHVALAGSVWDFQVTTLIGTNYISLMPEMIRQFFTKEMEENLKMLPIRESIDWTVIYCENITISSSPLLNEIKEYLLKILPGKRMRDANAD